MPTTGKTLDPIPVATLHPGAMPLARHKKGKNPTYTGFITSNLGEEAIPAYIKFLPTRNLFIEAVVYQVCKGMGVPIVDTFIAVVEDQAAPPELTDQATLALATRDSGHQTCATHLKHASKALAGWRALCDLTLLDEYVANSDRHPGNLLFDGARGFMAIDHDLAIPPGWNAAHPNMRNQLFESHIQRSEMDKKRLEKRLRTGGGMFMTPAPADIAYLTHATQFVNTDTISQVERFLKDRIHHLPAIIGERLNKPQRQLKLR